MDVEGIKTYLKNYAGPRIRIMEVCGSHTAAIEKNGIRGLLSDQISLISGPGCPVCVTPSAYIDHLLELAENLYCDLRGSDSRAGQPEEPGHGPGGGGQGGDGIFAYGYACSGRERA